MTYKSWILVELPVGDKGEKKVVLTSNLGLVLFGGAIAIREKYEELYSTNACCSQQLKEELTEEDSPERGQSL